MARVYYDDDADLQMLEDRTVAIIGYGSQGHAQAQTLRDSGVEVIVVLREDSPTRQTCREDGFAVVTAAEAARTADILHFLAPDGVQPDIFRQVEPHLEPGTALGFSHGFNIHFNQIQPPADVDVFMVAPKAPGHQYRRLTREGMGVPGLLAVHQDYTGRAKELALAFARAIGCTRAGVIETTFQEETETDLFGEQAVLCGGVTELVKAGFETLVDAGYQPEIAYFECLHELKLIVDLMYEGGLKGMRHSVSDTAQYGDMSRGHRVVAAPVREAMREILSEVQSGVFAREWILENRAGRPAFTALSRRESQHPIEEVGGRLRSMIAWLGEEEE